MVHTKLFYLIMNNSISVYDSF